MGLRPQDLQTVLARNVPELQFLEAAIRAYVGGIRTARLRNNEAARGVKWTIRFFVAGTILVAVAAVVSILRATLKTLA